MRLPARLTLPLIVLSFGVAGLGATGITLLVRRVTTIVRSQELAQFQRIAENTLRARSEPLTEVAGILVSLDGPVKTRLAEWRHVPVDAAVLCSLPGTEVRSATGAPLHAADLASLVIERDARDLRLVRGLDGGLFLASAARDRHHHTAAIAALRLDDELAEILGDLLQADLTVLVDGRPVGSSRRNRGVLQDALPVTLTLHTTAGAPVQIAMRMPAAGLARARRDALLLAAAGGVLLLGLAAVLYRWSLRRLSEPIRGLIDATHQIAAGRLTTALPPDAPAELGQLVGQFQAMAAALDQARTQLAHQAALASVGQVVAGVSHELNNPLSGLLTRAEYVAGRLSPGDPTRADVEIILEEGRRLKRILQDLRGLVRPGEGERVPVDLTALANDVLQFVRHDAAKAGVTCASESSPSPVTVLASPDQIRQVVLNLALNAIQAMPQGGALRFVTAMEPPHARLTVEDSGAGVPADVLPRLTEPFFTTKRGRLGLGLSVSDEICRRHGGRLAFDSGPGRGTRASLLLPVPPG